MQKFVESGTVRRLVVTGVAMVSVLLNKKLGLDIGEDQQELVVYLAMTYLLGSNGKEAILSRAKKAGDDAAAAVKDESVEGVILGAVEKEKEKQQ